MSQSGVGVGTMSHKCGKKSKESENCNTWSIHKAGWYKQQGCSVSCTCSWGNTGTCFQTPSFVISNVIQSIDYYTLEQAWLNSNFWHCMFPIGNYGEFSCKSTSKCSTIHQNTNQALSNVISGKPRVVYTSSARGSNSSSTYHIFKIPSPHSNNSSTGMRQSSPL